MEIVISLIAVYIIVVLVVRWQGKEKQLLWRLWSRHFFLDFLC